MPLNDVGVLLINLGTPQSPDLKHVRSYLKYFLSDPKVITAPAWLRWLLLNFVILPARAKKSAHAYASIWQEAGSPLLINSQKFVKNLAPDYKVALGMRYSQPNVRAAIQQLGPVQKLIILPLFPQYSSSATESALAETKKALADLRHAAEIKVITEFYQEPAYISAVCETIAPCLDQDFDYLLMSYHGLPLRQAGDYAQKCAATSTLIAERLQIPTNKWSVSFQSRLGMLPWIKPYTSEVLPQLYAQGVRKLLISCPSFVADCLETLEEIGIRARRQWLDLGGTSLTLIPSLNGEVGWIRAIIS